MSLFIFMLVFIAIAIGLAWFLIAHDHGEKEPVGALWLSVGFGFLFGILAFELENLLLKKQNIEAGAHLPVLLASTLAVGVIEEACKFVPLAVFLWRKRYFNEHTDGIIYFALAGLGFGLPENILYTVQFGSSAGLERLILTPIFHAAITGSVGFFLARRKLAGKSIIGIWPFLLVAMIAHGLYDFGLTSAVKPLVALSVLITLSASASLFILFQVALQRDQMSGLSTVGINNFCRSCGWPNPNHSHYCTHCGKIA